MPAVIFQIRMDVIGAGGGGRGSRKEKAIIQSLHSLFFNMFFPLNYFPMREHTLIFIFLPISTIQLVLLAISIHSANQILFRKHRQH